MLRHIHVETAMFSTGDVAEQTRKDLCWWLEALVQRNQDYLLQRPYTPRLYKSGVKYLLPQQYGGEVEDVRVIRAALGPLVNKRGVAEALAHVQAVQGGEHFCDIGVIMELGGIDCFPMTQKIICRSKSTGFYELLSLGELRHVYSAYEVLSFNFEKGRQEFRNIVGWVDKGEKAVSKVHLSNGTDIVATESHKFWTVAGQRQGNGVSDSRRIEEKTLGEFVQDYLDYKSGKISRAMYTVRSRILQAGKIPALSAVSPSAADVYLAGIYAAEGFKQPKMTGIAQHKLDVRQKIEEALVGAGVQFSYDRGRGATPGSGAQYRLLGGRANEVIARLRALGESSFDKKFPQAFLSASEGTVRQLLAAHADGDGWRPREEHAYKKAGVESLAVEHSTSSDALMEQIRLGLLVVGAPAYTYYQLDHQGEGDDPIWRVSAYNECASKLLARRGVVEKIGLHDMTYATVRGAERLGAERVGCIEVEGNHNFFLADGTLAANCDGLASWRVAELRQAGIKARPFLTNRKTASGGTIMHALVLWPPIPTVPYETSEDPSLLLGMGGADRVADRAEEIRKNQERCDILCKYGKPSQWGLAAADDGLDLDAALDGVFGVRRLGRIGAPSLDEALASIDRLYKRAA